MQRREQEITADSFYRNLESGIKVHNAAVAFAKAAVKIFTVGGFHKVGRASERTAATKVLGYINPISSS